MITLSTGATRTRRPLKVAIAALAMAGVSALAVPAAVAAPAERVGSAVSLATPTYELSSAVAGAVATDRQCVYTINGATGSGCIQLYGDRWWLKSKSSGAAVISWRNELWNGQAWVLHRHGSCTNRLGQDQWGACNQDYYESNTVNPHGYKGSRLSFEVSVNGTYSQTLVVSNSQ